MNELAELGLPNKVEAPLLSPASSPRKEASDDGSERQEMVDLDPPLAYEQTPVTMQPPPAPPAPPVPQHSTQTPAAPVIDTGSVPNEAAAPCLDTPVMGQMFDQFDVNGDGKIDRDEFVAGMRALQEINIPTPTSTTSADVPRVRSASDAPPPPPRPPPPPPRPPPGIPPSAAKKAETVKAEPQNAADVGQKALLDEAVKDAVQAEDSTAVAVVETKEVEIAEEETGEAAATSAEASKVEGVAPGVGDAAPAEGQSVDEKPISNNTAPTEQDLVQAGAEANVGGNENPEQEHPNQEHLSPEQKASSWRFW